MILDNMGAPSWLIRWRCEPPKDWGAMLVLLCAIMEDPALKFEIHKMRHPDKFESLESEQDDLDDRSSNPPAYEVD